MSAKEPSFRQLLEEYHIHDSRQVHVVATSAVREAANHLSFINRIYVASEDENITAINAN